MTATTPPTLTGAAPLPPRTRTARLAAALDAAGIDPTPVAAPPPWPDYIRTGRSEVAATERQEQARRAGRKAGTR